jgi:hypothetical protein
MEEEERKKSKKGEQIILKTASERVWHLLKAIVHSFVTDILSLIARYNQGDSVQARAIALFHHSLSHHSKLGFTSKG